MGHLFLDSVYEFGDLLLGRASARTSDEQIILYKLQGLGDHGHRGRGPGLRARQGAWLRQGEVDGL